MAKKATRANPTPVQARKALNEMLMAPIAVRYSSPEERKAEGRVLQSEVAAAIGLSSVKMVARIKNRVMWKPTELDKFAARFVRPAADRENVRRALHRLAARSQGWDV